MTQARLRSATIVPASLYVEREADRQLRRALLDMGRPCYVLVARQMGKTNLLLAAKRGLQGPDDVFVYNDLSNVPTSARECFRSLVDTALETHAARLHGVEGEIRQRRSVPESQLPPPHLEHDRELRILLSAISGKLVVILDEVDALTNAAFSDGIFAQIRSTYFSRANYPEFERLTYLLSGVADPGELIKNKKLSPFNIGEKIFLNDFSMSEVERFLEQAGLTFAPEVIQRVYYWTAGNPRMTWDTCAELETHANLGPPKPEDVDAAVSRLYLKTFDRAPVDHIRTLAEADRSIRSAITQIRFGKGSTLSDEVRNRLYLAGIVGAEGGAPGVEVKNRVIDRALSEDWFAHVERRKADSVSAMRGFVRESEFEAAIRFGEGMLASGLSADRESEVRELLSQAHFASGNYERAVEYAVPDYYDRRGLKELYLAQAYRIAFCFLNLGQHEKSIAKFREVVEGGDEVQDAVPALVNLATALSRHDLVKHRDEVIDLYLRGIALAGAASGSEAVGGGPSRADYAVIAQYNLAGVFWKLDDRTAAVDRLRQVVATAAPSTAPTLLLRLAEWAASPEDARDAIAEACHVLASGQGMIESKRSEHSLDVDEDTYRSVLLRAFEVVGKAAFREALPRFVANRQSSILRVHVELARLAVGLRKPEVGASLLQEALEHTHGAPASDAYDAVHLLLYLDPDGASTYAEHLLVALAGDGSPAGIDARDFQVLLGHAFQLGDDVSRCRQAVALLASFRGRTKGVIDDEFAIVDFLNMQLCINGGQVREGQQAARSILQAVPRLLQDRAPHRVLPADLLHSIREQAREVAMASVGRKVGRNDWVRIRYANGTEAERKFKLVESEIASGMAEFLTNLGPRGR